jgi:thioesterase domain-containing protein
MAHSSDGIDIFVGGGGDDWPILGLGVVRFYAARYAEETGRPTAYLPNARVRRIVRLIASASEAGPVNVIGHSWGGPDAYKAVVRARRRGLRVDTLITLDPVGGPIHRIAREVPDVFWLNVEARPSQPDDSDRLTLRRPFARKPSRLPVEAAHRHVVLDLNHWNVAAMMTLSGARARLDASRG